MNNIVIISRNGSFYIAEFRLDMSRPGSSLLLGLVRTAWNEGIPLAIPLADLAHEVESIWRKHGDTPDAQMELMELAGTVHEGTNVDFRAHEEDGDIHVSVFRAGITRESKHALNLIAREYILKMMAA